jgi:predicted RNA-binding Zn ribbon-like protein
LTVTLSGTIMVAMDPEPERPPAPGRLALVQDFVNSVELPDGDDRFATVAGAAGWLQEHNVAGASTVTSKDCERIIGLRESLRAVLTHGGDADVSAARSKLEQELSAATVRLVFSDSTPRLEAQGTGTAALRALLAAAIAEANAQGTWSRLKICADDTCRWAYFDHSKNGRGAWCSMRSCGSRAKARTYRERRRAR